MATKPGDDEKTPVWRQVLAGVTTLVVAVGAFVAVIPTIAFLAFTTPPGFQPTLLAYIVGGLLGVMLALFGAFVGERIQMIKQEKAKS